MPFSFVSWGLANPAAHRKRTRHRNAPPPGQSGERSWRARCRRTAGGGGHGGFRRANSERRKTSPITTPAPVVGSSKSALIELARILGSSKSVVATLPTTLMKLATTLAEPLRILTRAESVLTKLVRVLTASKSALKTLAFAVSRPSASGAAPFRPAADPSRAGLRVETDDERMAANCVASAHRRLRKTGISHAHHAPRV